MIKTDAIWNYPGQNFVPFVDERTYLLNWADKHPHLLLLSKRIMLFTLLCLYYCIIAVIIDEIDLDNVRSNTTTDQLYENNPWRGGVIWRMKYSYCYHPEVDYFAINAWSGVCYSAHTTVIWQSLQCLIYQWSTCFTFEWFIVGFNVMECPEAPWLLQSSDIGDSFCKCLLRKKKNSP